MDFGSRGEGYVRFCFARERRELEGALASMGALFGLALGQGGNRPAGQR